MNSWLISALIVVLIFCSAFFSSAETAYSSVSKVRLKNYADNGNKKAKRALAISEEYGRLISTILIGNNIVNIAASSLATLLFVSFLGDATGTLLSTVVLTIIVLTFGEVLPKNMAKQSSESLCMSYSGVLYVLLIIFKPFSAMFEALSRVATRLASHGKKQKPTYTEDELKYIIESSEEEGVLEEQESELVQSALEFDEKTAYDILTPRVDMVALDIDEDPMVVLKTIITERFSRIPVYKDNVDNIVGVLHTRDYLESLLNDPDTKMKNLLQPAYFIYRTKTLSSLLSDFKYKKLHIAIVTDDYGGTLGIVTMEDLLEQLVGDIWDEDEEVEHKYKKIGVNKYEISGDLNLTEFLTLFHKDMRYLDSDSKSVGGWALEFFGKIPENNDKFIYKEFTVTIKSIEDQRINSLLVEYTPQEHDEEEIKI